MLVDPEAMWYGVEARCQMPDMPKPETPGGDTRARARLGASGERVAAGWLEARGYQIGA
jgi:hypothetical protein